MDTITVNKMISKLWFCVFVVLNITCQAPESSRIIIRQDAAVRMIGKDDIKKIVAGPEYIEIFLTDGMASALDSMNFDVGKNMLVAKSNDRDSFPVPIVPATRSPLRHVPLIHSSEQKICDSGIIKIAIWHLESGEEKQKIAQLVEALKKIKNVEVI